jgi:hypothetical protein
MFNVGYFASPRGFEPLRYDYWPELLKQLEYLEVDSVRKEITLEPPYEDWHQYTTLVLPIDIANGGTEFGGSVALQYFSTDRVHKNLVSWVRKGGIFFCEVQSSGGRPLQVTYDRIFGIHALRVIGESDAKRFPEQSGSPYENVSASTGSSSRGATALVNRAYHGHPICFGIHPFVRNDQFFSGEPVIPGYYREGGKGHFSLYFRCPETLYSGWFVDWAKGWIPVLVESETGRWPVLLVRIEGEGAWVASTMRVTSSESLSLLRNIVFYKMFSAKWCAYHSRILKDRKIRDIVVLVTLWLCLVIFAGELIYYRGIQWFVDRFSIFHLIGGFSVLGFLSLLMGLSLLLWNRPLGHPSPVRRTLKLIRILLKRH